MTTTATTTGAYHPSNPQPDLSTASMSDLQHERNHPYAARRAAAVAELRRRAGKAVTTEAAGTDTARPVPRLIAMTPVEDVKPGDAICGNWRVTGTRQTAKRVYFTVEDVATGQPLAPYHQMKGSKISRWEV